MTSFRFAFAQPIQRKLLHQWFEQAHIKAWMHGVGLQNTLKGLEQFFEGRSKTTYWIGYDHDKPWEHRDICKKSHFAIFRFSLTPYRGSRISWLVRNQNFIKRACFSKYLEFLRAV